MLSIHSPDYVFTVLVSIFMKTHNHFWAPSQRYKYVFTAIYSKSDGVLCFHYSRMRIANDTYHVRTYERTYASSTVSRHSGAETKVGHAWMQWDSWSYRHYCHTTILDVDSVATIALLSVCVMFFFLLKIGHWEAIIIVQVRYSDIYGIMYYSTIDNDFSCWISHRNPICSLALLVEEIQIALTQVQKAIETCY